MKLITVSGQNSGVHYHRTYLPSYLMDGVDAHITNNISDATFDKGCDVFFYSRMLPAGTEADLQRNRIKHGFKVVVDFDDYWNLDPHHVLYENYLKNDIPAIQERHAREADAVFCTHERLAEKLYSLNKNVHVLPNAIPYDHDQFTTKPLPSDKVRIFWQGSVTHEKDIALLRNPFKRLDKSCLMVLSGYTENHPEWDAMVSSYTNGLRIPGTILKGTDPFNYYRHYSFADIAVVPLLDTPFNSYKSNLKVLEAANAGIPVIVSKVNPYLDLKHVNYVERQSDWFLYIRMLKDRNRRIEQGQALKEWAQEHYNFYEINERRKQAFFGIAHRNMAVPETSGRSAAA